MKRAEHYKKAEVLVQGVHDIMAKSEVLGANDLRLLSITVATAQVHATLATADPVVSYDAARVMVTPRLEFSEFSVCSHKTKIKSSFTETLNLIVQCQLEAGHEGTHVHQESADRMYRWESNVE